MPNRFTPPPKPRDEAQEIRSQLFLEVVLHGYAIVGALVVFRALLKSLGVQSTLWVGAAIYGITDLFERPLSFLPASGRVLAGDLTLADATLLACVVLFPLGLLVYGYRRPPR